MDNSRRTPRKPKKFRFQLLHEFIVQHYQPCTVADIGGGKGLLSHLLNQSGFSSTVIDPTHQTLPYKYKDLNGLRHTGYDRTCVPHITEEFQDTHAQNFDLLIGLHTHGCNLQIIDSATKLGKDFILLPCCVIDEPIEIRPYIDWIESVDLYAKHAGADTQRASLNFKGQNILIYSKNTTLKKS
jgi:hypothetical protein